ncbi:NAD-dependent epimerase/dehydratase family protein [Paludibacter sp.]|uniref:NAD-dependent epimerase/dehydratase family protein n=1 Tax=Paludibacter sp. TaxID=1898105 RepID=UPI00135600C5|nr:NAD-dependent epimerase/dehydratase family protein [Paludibacter sp.]MTK54227.1 NAD-dependent epimerase/dehydratase family protein [Paludibacter sp.]
MRVLVTGATGFLGGNLLRMLCDDGHYVRYLSRQGRVARTALDYPQAECCEGNLNDPLSLERACKDIDWIFHAAAIVSSLERDRSQMEQVNVEGTKSLFYAARKAGVKRFVHISSVDTIGIEEKCAIANEDVLCDFSNLRNPYPDTKLAAEKFLLQNKNTDIQTVVVNPGFMIGAYDTHGTSSRIVYEILNNSGLFAPSGGNSFVDVKDVCRGAILAAEKGRSGERYILAGHNLTYREFFEKVAVLCHRPKPLAVLPAFITLSAASAIEKISLIIGEKPIVTKNDAVFSLLPHYYSSQKAEKELGYVIHPIEPAIEDAITWFSSEKKSK